MIADEEISKQIAVRCRERRAAKAWTRWRLGEASGMSLNTIKNIEIGKRTPNMGTITRLCYGLGCTLEEFFKGL